MSLARLAVTSVLAVFAAGTVTACATRDMTAADAREFTRRALEEVGLDGIRVARSVDATVFRPTTGEPLDVWEVRATVDGGRVHLYVDREGDRAVFVNDVAEDGGALLTDEQFAALERFRLNPATERHRDRLRAPAGVAIALAVVASLAWGAALLTGRAALVLPGGRRRRLR